MTQERSALFERLLPVMLGLYGETAELAQGDGDLQLWYNRGYADGMALTLRELGFSDELEAAGVPASLSLDQAQAFLPWGKAYLHGEEMGLAETREVFSAG